MDMLPPCSLWCIAMAAAKYIGLWGQISSSFISVQILFSYFILFCSCSCRLFTVSPHEHAHSLHTHVHSTIHFSAELRTSFERQTKISASSRKLCRFRSAFSFLYRQSWAKANRQTGPVLAATINMINCLIFEKRRNAKLTFRSTENPEISPNMCL